MLWIIPQYGCTSFIFNIVDQANFRCKYPRGVGDRTRRGIFVTGPVVIYQGNPITDMINILQASKRLGIVQHWNKAFLTPAEIWTIIILTILVEVTRFCGIIGTGEKPPKQGTQQGQNVARDSVLHLE